MYGFGGGGGGVVVMIVFCVQVATAIRVPISDKTGGSSSNMNGDYAIANPNPSSPTRYSTDYGQRKAEFFDVYSDVIPTIYGEVFWTMMDPVPLSSDVVGRFKNKTIAVVGYEANQIFKTDKGEVSVPIYWSYNHHYEVWLLGQGAEVVPSKQHKKSSGHSVPGHSYDVKSTIKSDPNIPSSQYFSEGNGGEYRKSYHGYPTGYAQLLGSPRAFQIQPMQIDTHNRDYNGPGFKAGLLPKSSLAPPNADYSGLLECPCSTRINKTWTTTYTTEVSGLCGLTIGSANECKTAVTQLGLQQNPSVTTISNGSLPTGCFVTTPAYSPLQLSTFFNTAPSTTPCGGSNLSYGQSLSSLVQLTIQLNATAPSRGQVTITMIGPDGVWFGVGFNAKSMGDLPYVVVVDGTGNVSEHKIGNHNAGTLLSPTQVQVANSWVQNGKRGVVLVRAFAGATSDHYTFDPSLSFLPFIDAVGSTPTFSYHQTKGTANMILLGDKVPVCVCGSATSSGWINGIAFEKSCAPEPTGDLLQQKNPTCFIQTYGGGLNCCHHKDVLLDLDQPLDNRTDYLYLKFRFWFQEYQPPNLAASVSASHLNLHRFYFQTEAYAGEYDIVRCADGTPAEQCVQVITARWKVRDMLDCTLGDPGCIVEKGIELIYAGGHCHAPSCISLELYNADTGELLCSQVPVVGSGSNQPFDELGYIAIPPCLWGDPSEGLIAPTLFSLDSNLMSVKKNNNTWGHYGEMASWQMRGVFL